MNNQILSSDRIHKILKRIAFQVIENNFSETSMHLIGINGQGIKMAEELKSDLTEVKPDLSIEVDELHIDKENPVWSEIKLTSELEKLDDKVVVVVDDVMNTGRTQAYAIRFLLQRPLKKLETAVLVNRQHTRFPVAATYSGISLSTTLDEHIEVKLEDQVGAYLY